MPFSAVACITDAGKEESKEHKESEGLLAESNGHHEPLEVRSL